MADTVTGPDLLTFTAGRLPPVDDEERSRPIWEVLAERAREVPDEEFDRIPHDGAENHDHYLYGAPRKVSENDA